MDPLSITASIIAVLQAANAVVAVCSYYKGGAKVVDELRSLRDVLEGLAPLAAQAECADAEPAADVKGSLSAWTRTSWRDASYVSRGIEGSAE